MVTLLLSTFAICFITSCADPNVRRSEAIQQECAEGADALRNIKIESDLDIQQISSMANDYLLGLSSGLYSVNNVIPNIINIQSSYRALTSISALLIAFMGKIEEAIINNPNVLHEVLANILDEVSQSITNYNEYFEEGHNHFANDAIARLDFCMLFGVVKLKHQALLFRKTNEQLPTEIDESINAFTKSLQDHECGDKSCGVELRKIYVDASVIVQLGVYKLLNWVAANPDCPDVEYVKQGAATLSKAYTRLIQTAAEDNTYAELKETILAIYGSNANPIKQLASLEYPDNTGGLEFIWSTIFNAIAAGHVYAKELDVVLSN